MKKRNLIVFDIDGTLTDTVEIHQDAFSKSLRFIGIEKFNNSFGTYKHHTDSHIARVIFEFATNQMFEESIISEFEEYLFNQISQSEIREISGAGQFIKDIEDKTDFGVCYATGSFFKPAKLKLEKTGIDFHPVQLVTSNEFEEREKIIGKAIDNARSFYSVETFDRVISFGDGIWDLKAANNLSIEFVGIGNKNKEILKGNGMKRHYPDFCELNLAEL